MSADRRAYQREYMRRRRAANPAIREAARQYRREAYAKDPEKAREETRKWRAANHDRPRPTESQESKRARWRRYYLENRDRLIARTRAAKADNPARYASYQRARKHRQRSTTALTREQMDGIRALPCERCGKPGPNTLAHDLAVSRGGHTTVGNCFSLCGVCNSRMHTKTRAEFMGAAP